MSGEGIEAIVIGASAGAIQALSLDEIAGFLAGLGAP